MFYHRVLPPPPGGVSGAGGGLASHGLPIARRDSLVENKIIHTSDASSSTTSAGSAWRPLSDRRSSSDTWPLSSDRQLSASSIMSAPDVSTQSHLGSSGMLAPDDGSQLQQSSSGMLATDDSFQAHKASSTASAPNLSNVPSKASSNNSDSSNDTTPTLASTRFGGRKRARSPSPSEESHRHIRLPGQSTTAVRRTRSFDSSTRVCLCQPDPKVPRPRNAFILYRQHHQAAVVARNPGLANPEISKIIGDSWRNAGEDVKRHWKRLAEEEKVRHQKQYPDYRYQPRRAGRSSIASKQTTDPETQKCLKCGGKVMSAPQQLPTPGSTSKTSSGSPHGLPALTPGPSANTPVFFRAPSFPPISSSARERFIGPGYGPVSSSQPMPMRPALRSARPEDILSPWTPALKGPGYESYFSPDLRPPITSAASEAFGSGFDRRPSVTLARPGWPLAMQHVQVTAPPPPRPHAARSVSLHAARPAPMSLPAPPSARLAGEGADAVSRSSLEAMIKTIPLLHKIKALARIAPPLALTSTTPVSASPSGRGILIAVDGTDERAVRAVVSHVQDLLEREGNYRVQVSSRPDCLPPRSQIRFETWHQMVAAVAGEAERIAKFLTTPVVVTETSTDLMARSQDLDTKPTLPPAAPSAPLESDIKATAQQTRASTSTPTSIQADRSDEPRTAPGSTIIAPEAGKPVSPSEDRPALLPVAIVAHYQLSVTDAAAAAVPITDGFSPLDHWQWGASLWRGVFGPDLTLAIRSPTPLAADDVEVDLPSESTRHAESSPPDRSHRLSDDLEGTKHHPQSPQPLHLPRQSPPYMLRQSAPHSSTRPHSQSAVHQTHADTHRGPSVSEIHPGPNPGPSAAASPAWTASVPAVDVRIAEARAVLLRADGPGLIGDSALRRVGFEVGEWLRSLDRR